MRAARPGKGHLAAAPDPSPPVDENENQREELAELIAAAVADLLDGKPRGAQTLDQAIQMANSMGTAEAIYAAVEAYASHVSAVHSELKDADDQLQEARRQIAALRESLVVTRSQLESQMQHRMNRERPAPPKRRRRSMPTPADDVAGQDRRPDPETARTQAELMATLREFRQWAGAPPYRVMAERSGWGASTLNTIINSDELPDRLAKIDAVLAGCGGSQKDHERFASAWRRLSMPGTAARDENQDQPPAANAEKSGAPFVLYGANSDRMFGGGSGRIHFIANNDTGRAIQVLPSSSDSA